MYRKIEWQCCHWIFIDGNAVLCGRQGFGRHERPVQEDLLRRAEKKGLDRGTCAERTEIDTCCGVIAFESPAEC